MVQFLILQNSRKSFNIFIFMLPFAVECFIKSIVATLLIIFLEVISNNICYAVRRFFYLFRTCMNTFLLFLSFFSGCCFRKRQTNLTSHPAVSSISLFTLSIYVSRKSFKILGFQCKKINHN